MKNSKKKNVIPLNDAGSHLCSNEGLLCPDDNKKWFGVVGAYSPLKEEGFVKILINKGVSIKEEDGTIELVMPESWAVEFSEKIQTAIRKLKHLRVLNKLELLNEKAIHHDNNDQFY